MRNSKQCQRNYPWNNFDFYNSPKKGYTKNGKIKGEIADYDKER